MSQPVFPTSYFPNIQYLSFLRNFDEITLDVGEHFIKQTIRNRAYVLGPNSVLKLIVPLQKWKNNTSVKDIKISYSEDWQKLHWKTLEASYRSSPYFEYYEEKFKGIILNSNHEYLIDLNLQSINFILETLGLDPKINSSREYIAPDENEADFRNHLNVVAEITDFKRYTQVFGKKDFVENLSCIDLICNEGPNAIHLL